jgi:hypothetical protein
MTNLPKKVYFVLNPEGKVFQDSVREQKHLCKIDFVKSWFNSWGIHPNLGEADTVFGMFERVGFKIIDITLPIQP